MQGPYAKSLYLKSKVVDNRNSLISKAKFEEVRRQQQQPPMVSIKIEDIETLPMNSARGVFEGMIEESLIKRQAAGSITCRGESLLRKTGGAAAVTIKKSPAK